MNKSADDPKITLCPGTEVVAGDPWKFEEDGDGTNTQLSGCQRT